MYFVHFDRPSIRRGAATLACVLAASAVLGCGGGGDDPLTPEQAAAIVAAGLVTEADLPSLTWDIEELDNLAAAAEAGDDEGFDDFIQTTPACQALALAVGDREGEDLLADVERSFTNGGDSLVLRNVESNVFVPHPDVDIDARFQTLDDLFTADSLRACFEEGLRDSLESKGGIVISAIEISDPEHRFPDGVGVAVDLAAIALIIPIEMHLEMHMWPEGPAVGSLMFMEINSTLLQQNTGDIVDNAQSRLAAAVKAN